MSDLVNDGFSYMDKGKDKGAYLLIIARFFRKISKLWRLRNVTYSVRYLLPNTHLVYFGF